MADHKQGDHATKIVKNYTNWRALLLAGPQLKTNAAFQAAQAGVTMSTNEFRADVEIVVDEFLEDLQNAAANSDSEAFQNSLADKKPRLLRFCSVIETQLKTYLTQTKGRLTGVDNGDFFIGAMTSYYEEAFQVRKTLSTGKRTVKDLSLDVLQAGLLDQRKDKARKPIVGPFTNIIKIIKKSWISKKNALEELGPELIMGPLAKIQLSYEQPGSEQKVDNGAKRMRAELEREVQRGEALRTTQILTALEDCGLDPPLKPQPILRRKPIKVLNMQSKAANPPRCPTRNAKLPSSPTKSAKAPSPRSKLHSSRV
jgi:hypothetical protein